MFKFFNDDSPFSRGMNKIADYIILAVVYVFSCIPVITIGAASTAMYSTYRKVLQNDEGYVWRTFWAEFRSNFKQATLLWVIMSLIVAFLATDCYMAYIFSKTSTMMHYLFVVLLVISILCMIWMRYWFPYISHIEDSTKRVLKNTLIMCIAHLPYSLAIAVVYAACIATVIFLPLDLLFLTIIVAPIAYVFLSDKLFTRIFAHYWDMPNSHTEELQE